MAKKQWYQIEIECVKFNSSLTCKVGEKDVVAKVKSKGLAFILAKHLEIVYPAEFFNIRIL